MTRSRDERARVPAARPVRVGAWLAAAVLATAPAAAQEPPAELRGTVTGVAGERITIGLADVEWLPKLGTDVTIGLEMSGMFVPLKGRFVVVQLEADACQAQPVRGVEHGEAATGMLATLDTAYPNRPRSKADYREALKFLERTLPLADAGDPNGLVAVAMSYDGIGDADHALPMWARAQAAARDRLFIHNAAKRRVEILEMRGRYEDAVAVLRDGVSRTAPGDTELAWPSYDPSGAGVTWHVELLDMLAGLYRGRLGDGAQADAWTRKAVEVMAAVATRGAPPADGETPFRYLDLLMRLGGTTQHLLGDVEAAVPWYQMAARRGYEPAQDVLKKLGRSW